MTKQYDSKNNACSCLTIYLQLEINEYERLRPVRTVLRLSEALTNKGDIPYKFISKVLLKE
jgi:hypothetical protein